MATRKIYMNPGEMLEIRLINNHEAEKNATEWKYQAKPESILLCVHSYEHVSAADPAVYMDHNFTRPDLFGPQIPAESGN